MNDPATPNGDVTRRLQERFTASLTPEQRAWHVELADAWSDHRMWWAEQFEAEAVRHLPGIGPLVRMFIAHLHAGQQLDVLGKCCRSPEEEDADLAGEARP